MLYCISISCASTLKSVEISFKSSWIARRFAFLHCRCKRSRWIMLEKFGDSKLLSEIEKLLAPTWVHSLRVGLQDFLLSTPLPNFNVGMNLFSHYSATIDCGRLDIVQDLFGRKQNHGSKSWKKTKGGRTICGLLQKKISGFVSMLSFKSDC